MVTCNNSHFDIQSEISCYSANGFTGATIPDRKIRKFPFFRHSSAVAEDADQGRTGDVWLANAKSEGDDPDCISHEISQMVKLFLDLDIT